jgi:acyl-CoA synthetase (AMP-forming)/AMP-acid ligase II
MDHNLWTVFDAVAGAVPDRPVLRWRGKTTTFADLADRSRRLANVLNNNGIGLHTQRDGLAGWECGQDLVGMYMLNGPEFLETNIGGYAARAAPFNVNYRYVAEELAYLLNDAKAAAVVYHARFAPTLASVLPRLERAPLLVQVADDSGEQLLPGALDYEGALANASPDLGSHDHSPDDLYVLYTGGTTGMPKGTLWRQADIFAASMGGVRIGEDTDLDGITAHVTATTPGRFLPNAPFMHGAAQWLAFGSLLTGDTVVINDVVDHLDPKEVWATVEREKVDSTLMVGDAFARPLVEELEHGGYDASSLKIVVVGGAFTSPDVKVRLTKALPHVLILDAAGASETGGALSSVTTAAATAELGVFMPGPTVRVLNDARTAFLDPGADEIGWFAKSGRIPLGYLGDREKTEATYSTVGGVRYVVVGDRARLRADGMVELLGRDSVTINSGGEKIFAEEVEQALLAHPDVVDVVVTGRPSDRWGQEVVAVLSVRNDVSDDALLAAAAERIARYKLPKAIVRVDEVLRSPAGKADYAWARQQVT